MEILPQHAVAGRAGSAATRAFYPKTESRGSRGQCQSWPGERPALGKRHLHGTRGRPHMECPQYRWNLPLDFFFFCGTSMPICLLVIQAVASKMRNTKLDELDRQV